MDAIIQRGRFLKTTEFSMDAICRDDDSSVGVGNVQLADTVGTVVRSALAGGGGTLSLPPVVADPVRVKDAVLQVAGSVLGSASASAVAKKNLPALRLHSDDEGVYVLSVDGEVLDKDGIDAMEEIIRRDVTNFLKRSPNLALPQYIREASICLREVEYFLECDLIDDQVNWVSEYEDDILENMEAKLQLVGKTLYLKSVSSEDAGSSMKTTFKDPQSDITGTIEALKDMKASNKLGSYVAGLVECIEVANKFGNEDFKSQLELEACSSASVILDWLRNLRSRNLQSKTLEVQLSGELMLLRLVKEKLRVMFESIQLSSPYRQELIAIERDLLTSQQNSCNPDFLYWEQYHHIKSYMNMDRSM